MPISMVNAFSSEIVDPKVFLMTLRKKNCILHKVCLSGAENRREADAKKAEHCHRC